MKFELLLLLYTSSIFVLLSLQQAGTVKTCFFCAADKSTCMENMRAFQPVRMTCSDFLVRDHPMKKYFQGPNLFKEKPSVLYTVGLPEKNVKTLCMKMEYRFKDNRGVWNLSRRHAYYHDDNTYVLQSCMYQRVATFKNACVFYESLFKKYNIQRVSCHLCKMHDCNASLCTVELNAFLVLAFAINFLT